MALVEAVGEAVLSSGRMESNNVQSDAQTSATSLSNGISVIETARIPVVFTKELPDRCLSVGTKMDAGSRGVAKESTKGAGNAQQVLKNGTNEKVAILDECTACEPGGSTSNIPNGDGVDSTHFPSSGSRDYEILIESVINCLDEKVDKNSLTEEALELLSLVPAGYIPLPHQVGGHRHVDGKLGFLRKVGKPEILFKPVQPGNKGPREVAFYDSLFGDNARLDELPQDVQYLRDLIPHYYGITEIQDRAGHIHEFMMLEDITHKFRKPCILDVKIGKRVWDDFAEQDKIERERKKFPAQEIIGWRIIGMRIYRPATNDYTYYDKFFGRSVTEDSALEALSQFFTDGKERRVELIVPMLDKLTAFTEWFESQTTLKLFATSLLIVYEGDRSKPLTPDELLDIRLVDFAHTYERNPADVGPDENALFGLRNFMQFLYSICDQLL